MCVEREESQHLDKRRILAFFLHIVSTQVEEHLRWHGRHMGYNEEKRRLAKAWREERQHEQQAVSEQPQPLLTSAELLI